MGDSADALQALVEGARTVDQRVQLVQQYLINRLQQATRFDKAVTYCVQEIKRANGLLSVEELACRVGLSNRHLVRLFSQCIGISPKEFARMATFLQALKQLKQYPTLTLTEVAYESGYYDQAHFIHACRQYSGLSPTQLIATDSVLY
ncbi:helix-turn-helix domain-containing protein [Spirosoma sp. KNUC1025]|uniref:helix-turn-helix domain-containing protein n=1 Tax=Spirosoma sp. KNUC1025 TaxID=2894082 RepID=UPI0038630E9A|nr:helix-turn-helix domain-containing protein [Spirosoma sp. KNUC1025]